MSVALNPAARPQRGFSLLELAIALVIMGLLMSGLAMPLSTQSEIRARRETEKALSDIREALIGHAVAKGRLPCPAVATTPGDASDAGTEAARDDGCACAGATSIAAASGNTCSTPVVVGVLPWVTLGLPETDAWGRRYTYVVDTKFGRKPGQETGNCPGSAQPMFAGFSLCSSSAIEIKAASGGPSAVSGGVPAIAVSHGRNGFGAYTSQGRMLTLDAASADERENANGNLTFVSNTNVDDQLVWISSYVLMNRMLSAGMLP